MRLQLFNPRKTGPQKILLILLTPAFAVSCKNFPKTASASEALTTAAYRNFNIISSSVGIQGNS